jgi:hypothetical protein
LGDAISAHAITNFLLGVWVIWKGDWMSFLVEAAVPDFRGRSLAGRQHNQPASTPIHPAALLAKVFNDVARAIANRVVANLAINPSLG